MIQEILCAAPVRYHQRTCTRSENDMANDASARRPKASVVTAVCLLSCLALDAPYSPAAAADQVKIGIARTISDAGYYIADAMGFFREDGLDVSITGFNSAAQMIAPPRHRRTRCRRRHGVGRLLQRGRARHRHEDRGRSGLDQAGLWLFLADGAQGPRSQEPLPDVRRT